LTKLGAPDEALELLQAPRTRAEPRAWFYEAAARIARWEYREAIALLTRFLRHSGSAPYDRVIARVNLASGLVYEREYLKASYLIAELLRETGERRLELLHANVLQLAAYN